MNIYFSCSITGGRDEEKTYQKLVQTLEENGHIVPTAHLSTPQVVELEEVIDPVETFIRDMKWLREADAIVAEVSTPSHGVGYEIATALNLNKPVFCCFQRQKRVSKIITGNTSPTLVLAPYTSDEEAVGLLKQFLTRLES
jgi:nucleoside 2-deoxyribosyltransferase